MGEEIYDQIGRLKMDLEWLKRIWAIQLRPKGQQSTCVLCPSEFVGHVSWSDCIARPAMTHHGRHPRSNSS